MTRELAVLITLVGYKIVLIMIGLWANRRTRDTADFFLGGRSLGPWVAAISASASSSSAWSLLGVSGAAYVWGLSAIWLFPSVFLGFLFNWLWLAPRIRVAAERQGAVTVTDMLIGSNNPLARPYRHILFVDRDLFPFLFMSPPSFRRPVIPSRSPLVWGFAAVS